MILVDTSVWVDHLQRGNDGLAERLLGGLVCTHPYVVGELALGNLKQRATVLEAVQHLPALATATDLEVLAFILETAVGCARVCRERRVWQGETKQRTPVRNEEQRRQGRRARCNRVHSAVT